MATVVPQYQPNPLLSMAGPIQPLGVGSPIWHSEWNSFLQTRQQLLEEGRKQLGFTSSAIRQGVMDPQTAAFMGAATVQRPRANPEEPVRQEEYEGLLGAADFYGIDGAHNLTPSQLRDIIIERRQLMLKQREEGPENFFTTLRDIIYTTAVGGTAEMGETLQNMIGRVPFIGDAIRNTEANQGYIRWLDMLQESATGDMTENERVWYEAAAKPWTQLLTYGIVVGATERALRSTGFIGGISNPLIRGAVAGGTAGLLWEGGGDAPLLERGRNILLNATAGGLFEALPVVLPKIIARIQGSFPRKGVIDMPYGINQEARVVDADWSFEGGPTGTAVVPYGAFDEGTAPPLALYPSPLPPGPAGPLGLPPTDMPPGTFYAAPGMTQFARPQVGFPEVLENIRYEVAPLGLAESVQDASQFTKQLTVLESPVLPVQAAAGRLDDADVAVASLAKNPGQVSVIRNVGDVGGTVRRFLQDFMPNGVGPQDFRVVTTEVGFKPVMTSLQREHIANLEGQLARVQEGLRLDEFPPGFPEPRVSWERARPVWEADAAMYQELIDKTRNTPYSAEMQPIVRTDILVSDGAPITNKMVKEYEQHGFFTGQRVSTLSGVGGTVSTIGPEVSTIRMLDGTESQVPTAQIFPGRSSAVSDVPEEAYVEMQSYALGRMAQEADHANLQPFGWYSEELSSQLPRYIEEFLDMQGIESPGLRGTYIALFTEQRVKDFQRIVPEETAQTQAIVRQANDEYIRLVSDRTYMPSVAEAAETKGLRFEREYGSTGGTIYDEVTGESVQVASEEAAYGFIHEFNRDLPDLSPVSTVPVEAMPLAAMYGGPSSSVARDFEGTTTSLVEAGERTLAEFEDILGPPVGGSGGGSVPPFIGDGGGGGFGGGAGALPPGGSEWQRLHTNNFGRWRAIEVQFDNSLSKLLDPMRMYATRMANITNAAGLQANLFDDVARVQNSVSVANNEIHSLGQELQGILAQFRYRYVRNGTVTMMQEMNPATMPATARTAGYTDREIAAQFQLRDFIERVRQEYGVRWIQDYMPHLTASGSPEIIAQEIERLDFTGPGRWFAEVVRRGGIQFREPNADVLMSKWLRGAAFSRHVAPLVDDVQQRWVADPYVPENARLIVGDWLHLVTTGYAPGSESFGDGLAGVFQTLGVPVTGRDVESLIRVSMANNYRAMLGGRPVAVIREIINPLMAWARTGNGTDLASTVVNFARDPQFRAQATALAQRGGWLVRQPVSTTGTESLRVSGTAVPGFGDIPSEFGPRQNAVREAGAAVRDMAVDAMNRVMPQGYTNSWADPLRPLDAVNEMSRVITGQAAYTTFQRALGNLNEARLADPLAPAQQLYSQLLVESGAANYSHPFQRALVRLLRAGDDEGAAFLFANEVTNQMGRFGGIDSSVTIQRSGMIGRVGAQLGNFAMQYAAHVRGGLVGSGLAPEFGGHRVASAAMSGSKFLMRHGAVVGALGAASAYSGWNFGKWYWHSAIGFAGGPMAWYVLDKVRAWGAWNKEQQGLPLTPQERAVLQDYGRDNIANSMFNPYAGAIRTVDALQQTTSAANPWETTAQFMVTGERANAEMRRDFRSAEWGLGPTPPWLEGTTPVFEGGSGAAQ